MNQEPDNFFIEIRSNFLQIVTLAIRAILRSKR